MSAERDEARRKAGIMLAFADGAEVQAREWLTNIWFDVNPESSGWDSARYDYRVKPKPREVWAIYDDLAGVWIAYNNEADAHRAVLSFSSMATPTIVHMREVTE